MPSQAGLILDCLTMTDHSMHAICAMRRSMAHVYGADMEKTATRQPMTALFDYPKNPSNLPEALR